MPIIRWWRYSITGLSGKCTEGADAEDGAQRHHQEEGITRPHGVQPGEQPQGHQVHERQGQSRCGRHRWSILPAMEKGALSIHHEPQGGWRPKPYKTLLSKSLGAGTMAGACSQMLTSRRIAQLGCSRKRAPRFPGNCQEQGAFEFETPQGNSGEGFRQSHQPFTGVLAEAGKGSIAATKGCALGGGRASLN